MKKQYLFLIAIFIIGCSDSSHVIEMNLPIKNPTSYVFNFPLTKIFNELHNFANTYRTEMYIDYRSKGEKNFDNLPDSLNYLIQEGYFIITEIKPFPPYSKLFVSVKGEPIYYYAKYVIRLFPITPSKTEIQILTFQNYVLLGETGSSKFASFVFGADLKGVITRYVPISTIEEYEILLKVGKYLGVEKDMPSLKTADRNKMVFHY